MERSDFNFPTRRDFFLLGTLAVLTLSGGKFNKEPQPPETPPPVPTRGVYPTMVPAAELSFATRRWCQDVTIDGKRDCGK